MCNGANCMHKIEPAQSRTGLNQRRGERNSLRLRAPFGSNYLVEPDDILDIKRALMALDYYQPLSGTEPGAFVDNDLFAGIKAFQRDHGLKVDGFIRPGGETETTLNAALRHADPSRPIPDGEGANDNQPPANENEPGWDEAAKGKYGKPWLGPPKKGPTQEEQNDHNPGVPGGRTNAQCWENYQLELSECDQKYRNNFQKRAICQTAAFERYVACKQNRSNKPGLPGRRK